MTPTPGRRVAVVLLLLAVLGAGIFADRIADEPVTSLRALPGTESPEAPPLSALSSSWYCPGGNADGGALAASIAVLNPRDEPVQANVTVIPSSGESAARTLDIPPLSSESLALTDVVKSPWAAALVEVDGGGIVVEQQNGNPTDFDTAPCSPAASTTWYFASGSTARDAALTLALFNPFPDDAIVDLAFATPEGRRVPGDFQGIVVPAASVVPVDIGAHVRRQDVVSTEVKARAGRVVALQGLVRTGAGVAGVSMTLGAPKPGLEWLFADGLVGNGVAERFELFNPNEQEARVDIELALEEGEAEPFELTVPAQGRFTLDVAAEGRVPPGVAHAALAVSVNNVPVVVTRVIESNPPAPRRGRADTLGARRMATRWGLALGSATEAIDEWVVVFNPSEQPSMVSVKGIASGQSIAIDGLQDVNVPAGRRVALRLTDHIKRDVLPLVVEASRAVVVERAMYVTGGSGLAASVPIPLDY